MKVIRIILSPIVFLISLGAMIIFPGIICFGLGLMNIIGKILQERYSEVDKSDWSTTFILITFPIMNTSQFIKNGNFLD